MKSFSQWAENIEVMNVEDPEEKEMSLLSGQMKTLLDKMTTLISKMRNKNKGYEILYNVSKSVQDATNMTDSQIRKAVLGQMPQQMPQQRQ